MTAPTISLPLPERRGPSIAFPLVLISLGLLFLLANTGYLNGLRVDQVLRLWPVLLVLGGVDILLRPRSFAIALFVEICIIGASILYLASGATAAPVEFSQSATVPRAGVTDMNLTVNYGAGRLSLSTGTTDLVAITSTIQDIDYSVMQTGSSASVTLSSSRSGFIWDGSDRNWSVRVPTDVRTGMTLNLGAGDFDVDLTQVQLVRATINAGASSATVRLPATVKGDVRMTISTGASDLKIYVPQGLAYRVIYSSVVSSQNGPMESANYATSTDRLTITVSTAAGSVSIR